MLTVSRPVLILYVEKFDHLSSFREKGFLMSPRVVFASEQTHGLSTESSIINSKINIIIRVIQIPPTDHFGCLFERKKLKLLAHGQDIVFLTVVHFVILSQRPNGGRIFEVFPTLSSSLHQDAMQEFHGGE